MFTNLIGFIKPLLKKQSTETKRVAKSRQPGEDEPRRFEDFEDLVDIHHEDDRHADDKPAGISGKNDELELSITALRQLVEQSKASAEQKKEAWHVLTLLEKQGRKTLPFSAETSIIEQLKTFNRDQ